MCPNNRGLDSPYWIKSGFLAHTQKIDSLTSWPGDWNLDYFDGSADQAYHFWGIAALTYYMGPAVAWVGSHLHDPVGLNNTVFELTSRSLFDYRDSTHIPELMSFYLNSLGGTSAEDLNLSMRSIEFGILASQSIIPFNPSQWIRENLTVSTP